MDSTDSSLASLLHLINTIPIFDNHTHPILPSLKPTQTNEADSAPLHSLASLASGSALDHTPSTLASFRAVRQLSQLYECEPTWECIEEKRKQVASYDELVKRCCQGYSRFLVDDMIVGENMEYEDMKRLTGGRIGRIVKIESIAEEALEMLLYAEDGNGPEFERWEGMVDRAIAEHAFRANVLGFKSVVGYRSGLNVRPEHCPEDELEAVFNEWVRECQAIEGFKEKKVKPRLVKKVLCDLVVRKACQKVEEVGKPMQIHTGIGEDLNLANADPSLLQPLIRAYPKVKFVLLHASYPYTRQAGYLASIHENVYVDFGLVFPKLSMDGQASVFRQLLETCPASKLLWSSDAQRYPEMLYLAAIQVRETIAYVLQKYLKKGQVSFAEASTIVEAVLSKNAKSVYLNCFRFCYPLEGPQKSTAKLFAHTLRKKLAPAASTDFREMSPKLPTLHKYPSQRPDPSVPAGTTQSEDLEMQLELAFSESTIAPNRSRRDSESFNGLHIPGLKYLRVQWVDYTGSLRLRLLPISEVNKQLSKPLEKFGAVRVTTAFLYLLQDDSPIENMDPSGMLRAEPDWSSLRKFWPDGLQGDAGDDAPFATVMCSFNNTTPDTPFSICPRNALVQAVAELETKYSAHLLLGFETEVTFFKRLPNGQLITSIPHAHSWSQSTALTPELHALTQEIADEIQAAGIPLLMYHAESANSQFEFVTSHLPCLPAIDALYHTRLIISTCAERHGFRATLHPKPYSHQAGTAAHIHFSLNPSTLHSFSATTQFKARESSFIAGLLSHLPALTAFSLPTLASYSRLTDGAWAGGTYIIHGTENRECPLRRCLSSTSFSPHHWELRCVDGTANLYLTVAALIHAGLDGIHHQMELPVGCAIGEVPARMSEEERKWVGVFGRMPASLEEGLESLRKDDVLRRRMGGVVDMVLGVGKAGMRRVREVRKAEGEGARWRWEVERY